MLSSSPKCRDRLVGGGACGLERVLLAGGAKTRAEETNTPVDVVARHGCRERGLRDLAVGGALGVGERAVLGRQEEQLGPARRVLVEQRRGAALKTSRAVQVGLVGSRGSRPGQQVERVVAILGRTVGVPLDTRGEMCGDRVDGTPQAFAGDLLQVPADGAVRRYACPFRHAVDHRLPNRRVAEGVEVGRLVVDQEPAGLEVAEVGRQIGHDLLGEHRRQRLGREDRTGDRGHPENGEGVRRERLQALADEPGRGVRHRHMPKVDEGSPAMLSRREHSHLREHRERVLDRKGIGSHAPGYRRG